MFSADDDRYDEDEDDLGQADPSALRCELTCELGHVGYGRLGMRCPHTVHGRPCGAIMRAKPDDLTGAGNVEVNKMGSVLGCTLLLLFVALGVGVVWVAGVVLFELFNKGL